MHVFSHILENSVSKREDGDADDVEILGADHLEKETLLSVFTKKKAQSFNLCLPCTGPLARNRWFVAYTLVRNPSIQQYTAKNIQLLREQEERNQDRVFALEDAIIASGHELVVALDAADLDQEQGVEDATCGAGERETVQGDGHGARPV